jgi:hypothetical protein
MKDYAQMYHKRYKMPIKPTVKLHQIRKLILSGLPPEIIVMLIAALVIPLRK